MIPLNSKFTYFTGVFKEELLCQNYVLSKRVHLCSSLPLLKRDGFTGPGTGDVRGKGVKENALFPASPSHRPTHNTNTEMSMPTRVLGAGL